MSGPVHEVFDLDLLRVTAQRHIDLRLVEGLQRPHFDVISNYTADTLVAQLNAYVLTEHAGRMVTDHVRALLPVRPRWMPRWLWRRIPTRDVEWTLRVRPRWTYPRAGLRVPELGDAVRFAQTYPPHVHVPDWRDE
jgi:hypothetical protein